VTLETLPDDIAALQTALLAERAARQQAEARASGAEAMVAYLKLLIAKMKRERFGQSAERGRKLLDQLGPAVSCSADRLSGVWAEAMARIARWRDPGR